MIHVGTFCSNVVDWKEGDNRYSGKTVDAVKGFCECEVTEQPAGVYAITRVGKTALANPMSISDVREEESTK